MGSIHDRMRDDLILKNYSRGTMDQYLRCARSFLKEAKNSPLTMSQDSIRSYLVNLAKKKNPATVKMHVAAIRFLYGVTLKCTQLIDSVYFPKVPLRLPDILSHDEVHRLLMAVQSPKHRAVLLTAYGTGMRIAEACSLLTTDIDSQRGVIHIRNAKRARDRFVMLSPVLLTTLREYWKLYRPTPPILFPSDKPGRSISPRAVQMAFRSACSALGITKKVTPHSLRHAFATHLIEDGTDIRTIQSLLGHSSIRSTVRYTKISTAYICKIPSPIDKLPGHFMATR